MTHYYKVISDNIITQIGSGQHPSTLFPSITEEDYNRLLEVMQNKPDDTLEQKYVLSAETESYKPIPTTHDDKVRWYFNAVNSKEMVLTDVPEEFRSEVQAMLPNNPYGIPNEQWLKIQAETQQAYRTQLAQEVSK